LLLSVNSQTNSLLPRTFDNEVVGSFFLVRMESAEAADVHA